MNPTARERCPFCHTPIGEYRVVLLGQGRVRYYNDCSCLDWAEGVFTRDGSVRWEQINRTVRKHDATPEQLAAWQERQQWDIDVEKDEGDGEE